MNESEWFSQGPHRVRMDWGWRGCVEAAVRGDAIVIVDVIRFSTAVCAAAAQGIAIYPTNDRDDLAAMCAKHEADQIENALAPGAYASIERGRRVVLRSPNGATCVRRGSAAPIVLIAALVNRSAVAACVRSIVDQTRLNVSVIACGERRRDASHDGALRFAIEDYLGAGSILSLIDMELSAEARACAGTFRAAKSNLTELIADCVSGREQIDKGDRDSVEYATTIDRHDVVPILRDRCRIEALEDFSEIDTRGQTRDS